MPVGVTAFFIPGADGKDLGDIFRQLVVPVLLENLHLPPRSKSDQRARPGRSAFCSFINTEVWPANS
jgi:hypothetical protein